MSGGYRQHNQSAQANAGAKGARQTESNSQLRIRRINIQPFYARASLCSTIQSIEALYTASIRFSSIHWAWGFEMKKTWNDWVLLLCLLAVSTSAHSSGWLGIGDGGEFGGSSISLGMRGYKWGGGIGFVFNSDYSEDKVLDYPVPHNDFVILDSEAYIGNTFGFDIFRFFNIKESQSIFLGLGIYFSKVCQVARSNATGWLYCEDENTKMTPSGNVGYMINLGRISLGLGYHSGRGTELTIGTGW